MKRRTNAASGAYLLRRAARLAQQIRTRNGRKREVIDGFLVEGRKNNGVPSATVLDAPGRVVVFGGTPASHPDNAVYGVGFRDSYNHTLATPDGPYVAEELAPQLWRWQAFLVRFSEGDRDIFAGSRVWRSIQVAQGANTFLSWTQLARPPVSFPYDVTEQVPIGTYAYAAFVPSPSSVGMAGYVLSESEVARLAPGYALLPRTDLGYMSYQYHGMPGVGAVSGPHTLLVAPVVSQVDPTSAVSWGHSALLIIVFRQAGDTHQMVGHTLWTPDEHSADFFHNGPWEALPAGRVGSPYILPKENWDAFWEDWSIAKPTPAGGSRPNWIDGLSATWFNGRFVVGVRLAALNGTLQAGDEDYAMVGGSARVRLEVGLGAEVAMTEVSHEVWAVEHGDPKLDAPHNRWVAGVLDESTVRLADPLCTIADADWLVECSLIVEGSRTNYVPVTLSLTGTAHPVADLESAHLEVLALRVVDGVEVRTTHQVYFHELGAGIMCPTDRPTGDYQLWRPTVSYKLWPATSQFSLFAPNELGFVCYASWQQAFSSAPASFASLNLVTGAVTLLGELGLYGRGYINYETPVHIDCVQRKRLNYDNTVAIEAVLLASCAGHDGVRISRDSGATWTDYITGVTPLGGAYYTGSVLRPNYLPGTAAK